MSTFPAIQSELTLVIAACALFLLGVIDRAGTRRLCAWIAMLTVVGVFIWQAWLSFGVAPDVALDSSSVIHSFHFAQFVRMLTAGVGVMMVLLAWPTNATATGNNSLDFATEAGEFFALMLLSICGVFVVAGANDIILLFLGIELASIPTYIMVSISRPLPVAQEAGVKYFFLGAMSAAILLFGFSYLYGTTGATNFNQLASHFTALHGKITDWQMLALVMIIAGLAFKMAAVPLHFYAGDVYQGAATPVTALLAFVPKTSGLVALIKMLFVFGGGGWPGVFSHKLATLIWTLAVLTMFAGNLLGLLQHNVKRILAYSSVAHSGYMLVGVATMVGSSDRAMQQYALTAVLFYLASYGIMNAAAFGVLMLFPAKAPPTWDRRAQHFARPGASAETLDDLAGAGRRNLGLGLAMAIACFSLTGLPLTVGFFGKLYLIQAAWRGEFFWLIVLMMINAAISAGYYLRIVATIFLRSEDNGGFEEHAEPIAARTFPAPRPIVFAIGLSCIGTLIFGCYFPGTEILSSAANTAVEIDPTLNQPPAPVITPIKHARAKTEGAKIALSDFSH